MLLAACSGDGGAPEALAFQDDSSGGTGAVTVNRPVGNPCSSNEFSVAFDQSVLLLDPAPATAGPFSVDVPAGTYDIVVSTWFGFEDDPSQTMEQWFFTTDSGYTSPTTDDPSIELLWNQEFQGQTIGDTTSVTLHHKAPGMASANSVHPLCIGFRSVAVPEETTTTTAAPETTEAPVVTEAPETTEAPVVTEAPETTEAPVVTEAPEETATTTSEPQDAEVAGPTTTTTVAEQAETAGVAAQASETTTTSTTTTVTASATAAPELALTGPSELATSLGLTGAALVLAGSAAVVAARRSEDD